MPRLADSAPIQGEMSPLGTSGAVHILCIVACGIFAAADFWTLPLAAWLCLEGASAAIIGKVIGLPGWWFLINFLFFPLLYLSIGLELPPFLFLGMFCALFLVNGAAWLHRVPFFLSSDRAASLVCTLLPHQRGFRLIDLGCGNGKFLSCLARQRPDGHYRGIELAPVPFLCSRWRAFKQPSLSVQWGDFWNTNLEGYDVVYAYLSPVPMNRLWDKACGEMRPGSLFISNGFHIAGARLADVVEVGDAVRSRLYVWRM